MPKKISIVSEFHTGIEKILKSKSFSIKIKSNPNLTLTDSLIEDEIYLSQREGMPIRVLDRLNTTVVSWNMREFPSCCGICLVTDLYVNEAYSRKGLGELAMQFAMKVAKTLGYKLFLGTDVADNEATKRIAKKNKWRTLTHFSNKNSGNIVNVYSVVLS